MPPKPAAASSSKPAAGAAKPAAAPAAKKEAAPAKAAPAAAPAKAAPAKKEAAPSKAAPAKKEAAPAAKKATPGAKKDAAPAKKAAPAKAAAGKAAPAKAAPAKATPKTSVQSGKGGKVVKGKGKKVAPLPEALKGPAKKVVEKKAKNPLIETRPKNFGLGGTVQPKRDLGRYVKWPKYVRIQRQRAILKKRLKVPPSINQFTKTLDKNTAVKLFRFLGKYRPETKQQKQARLKAAAAAKVDAAAVPEAKEGEKKKKFTTKKPHAIKYGLNHITALIENKKAQLVVIAHDVDPIELVVWLPALCRKMGVAYCIVKSKSRLGALVHKKNAAALCVATTRAADKKELASLVTSIKERYNKKADEIRKSWGGGVMGFKSRTRTAILERTKRKEAEAKNR